MESIIFHDLSKLTLFTSYGFWHRSWGAVAEGYRSRITSSSSSNPTRPQSSLLVSQPVTCRTVDAGGGA